MPAPAHVAGNDHRRRDCPRFVNDLPNYGGRYVRLVSQRQQGALYRPAVSTQRFDSHLIGAQHLVLPVVGIRNGHGGARVQTFGDFGPAMAGHDIDGSGSTAGQPGNNGLDNGPAPPRQQRFEAAHSAAESGRSHHRRYTNITSRRLAFRRSRPLSRPFRSSARQGHHS